MQYKDINFTLWDVGGCDKIKPLWRHYYQNTQVVIFVIDCNDRDRIEQAIDDLKELIMTEEEMKDAHLLIFANKQDLPNALSVDEIKKIMKLEELLSEDENRWKKPRNFHIQPSCAVTGNVLVYNYNRFN